MNLEESAQKLRLFFRKHKRAPSYQEMCSLFGFASKRSGFLLAKRLIKAGILVKDTRGKLSFKNIIPPLPFYGPIKAGMPTPAEEQLLSTMSFDDYIVENPDRSFVLKVSGDSMIGAGIHHGDLVIIEKDRQAKEGDVVVALIDQEWTLKYFRQDSGKTYLRAANPKYPDIYPYEELRIWGTVVSVIRKYH